MKTTRFTYKTAVEKKLPWVDWFCCIGTAKVGCIYTRTNKIKYLAVNGNKGMFANGPLEAEYKARLLLK